ncbi:MULTISPECIES: protein-L-isoaspartate O-methyltransferase family protein [Cysteiniphilum]|uniref:Protein-L-isoaspartate O-methyltransferase n=1 Tax=Cysteiniphilum litorale TaxID=2056700 RepID=A0A8J2Z3M6_9GAMM|nr:MULTISPECIES: methyltransferase domain-containing protein [Cysteiniphilum]GGF95654.1 protein-L-isoaspartate O-methyltransferase [Cysteiniphilum litorale]
MNIELAKENMIKQQIRTLGVPYGDLLSVIIDTPREVFVPSNYKEVAYSEVEIPLNHHQYELTPQTVTKMLQLLQPKKHERVLEIGCGSGYLTALLAKLTKLVDVVDQHEDMLNHVKNALKTIGVYNAKYHVNKENKIDALNQLLQQHNVFDLVIVKEMEKSEPTDYLKYLAANGRMLYFLEKDSYAKAVLVQKNTDGSYQQMSTFDVYKPVGQRLQDKTFQF